LGGRPDRLAGVSLTPPGGPTANGWFNATAFKCPDANPICPNPVSPGRFGNAGLNILQGPPMKNADIARMKDFAIHERFKIQFQAVFANAFNHPSFARPCSFVMNGECYADITSPATVGHITATDAAYLKGSQAQRNINFALRIRF
jgi:hypothetical protein